MPRVLLLLSLFLSTHADKGLYAHCEKLLRYCDDEIQGEFLKSTNQSSGLSEVSDSKLDDYRSESSENETSAGAYRENSTEEVQKCRNGSESTENNGSASTYENSSEQDESASQSSRSSEEDDDSEDAYENTSEEYDTDSNSASSEEKPAESNEEGMPSAMDMYDQFGKCVSGCRTAEDRPSCVQKCRDGLNSEDAYENSSEGSKSVVMSSEEKSTESDEEGGLPSAMNKYDKFDKCVTGCRTGEDRPSCVQKCRDDIGLSLDTSHTKEDESESSENSSSEEYDSGSKSVVVSSGEKSAESEEEGTPSAMNKYDQFDKCVAGCRTVEDRPLCVKKCRDDIDWDFSHTKEDESESSEKNDSEDTYEREEYDSDSKSVVLSSEEKSAENEEERKPSAMDLYDKFDKCIAGCRSVEDRLSVSCLLKCRQDIGLSLDISTEEDESESSESKRESDEDNWSEEYDSGSKSAVLSSEENPPESDEEEPMDKYDRFEKCVIGCRTVGDRPSCVQKCRDDVLSLER